MHTPTPWVENDWSVDSADGYCVCEGFMPGEDDDVANRARIVACVNFFHGRPIATERIPEGGFWLLVNALRYQTDVLRAHNEANLHSLGMETAVNECEALLAKLGIEP